MTDAAAFVLLSIPAATAAVFADALMHNRKRRLSPLPLSLGRPMQAGREGMHR